MKKRTSIKEKVLAQTVKLPIITLIILIAIVLVGFLAIRANVTSVSGQLGALSASSSREMLEKQAKEQLVDMAKNKVALSDTKLKIIQDNVKLIANNATNVLRNSTIYQPVPVLPADAKNEGKFVAQLKYAEGIDYETIKSEVGLMGNMHVLVDVPNTNSMITKTYIGSESGFVITADDQSGEEPKYLDIRTRPWYTSAKKENKLIWTDVYDDVYGNGFAMTCAMPYFDANGEVKGVAGIGWLIKDITDIVVGTNLGESGYSFVINQNGDKIISPTLKKDKKGNLITENLLEDENPDMQRIAKEMIAGKDGIETVTIEDKEYFIAYEPFQVLPWSVANLVPVEEIIKPALISEKEINAMTVDTVSAINKSMFMMLGALALGAIIMLSYIAYSSRKIADGISKPIIDLTKGAEIIGSGDLSHKLEVDTGDELERLANTFNLMIDNIQNIAAEKERIGTELNVATQIQASMLPCIFPAFPDKMDKFDVYATMTPAKEVGGDFYDFFTINESKIGLVIADVSGKGVPAALFMVIAKTLIKNHSQIGKSPKAVLQDSNNQLCEGNDTMMFVTCFMGILDINTGEFTYVNAGHNPPLLMRKGEKYQWMEVASECVLAVMEGTEYTQNTVMMEPGDRIYMYTDGVTEAINEQEEQFSEERLIATLNELRTESLQDTLHVIKERVDEFCGTVPQFDDVTMLSFEYKGK